jgi:hypothetical protein
VRLPRVPNWEERVGEVWAFALGSFLTPIPRCFSYECERKRVAGKGCWKLLKTQDGEMGETEKAEMAGCFGRSEFEASQPRIAWYLPYVK